MLRMMFDVFGEAASAQLESSSKMPTTTYHKYLSCGPW